MSATNMYGGFSGGEPNIIAGGSGKSISMKTVWPFYPQVLVELGPDSKVSHTVGALKWCHDNYGDRWCYDRPEAAWDRRIDFDNNVEQWFFRDEKMATLFLLRWA